MQEAQESLPVSQDDPEPPAPPSDFADRLLTWFEHHGRHDLPWQQKKSVYRVWVSEIMLQQTQVATAIPYFERFVSRYPDVFTLAASSLDELLALWAGLGYYARARNLLKTARLVVKEHQGEFPRTLDTLMSLPGIGRSTAGAILSIGFNLFGTILDGNVRRVLARHQGIEGWPGRPEVGASLWRLAERLTPRTRTGDYSQAIMDLGATLCRRSRPNCGLCPLRRDCLAFREGRQGAFPGRRPAREKPVRTTCFLMLQEPAGRVLLQRRPPVGVWGGLWSFPERETRPAILARYGVTQAMVEEETDWSWVRHSFTHFHLDILPRLVLLARAPSAVQEEGLVWVSPGQADDFGCPAPVVRLLTHLPAAR